jgi:hypothetical protein
MLSKKLTFVVSDTSTVIMKVYDAIGHLVATPVNEKKPAGVYSVNFDTTGLASGTYFMKYLPVVLLRSQKSSYQLKNSN